MNTEYSNRELDMKFDSIHEKLDLILAQTTKHNGRLTRLERIVLVLGVSSAILIVTKFPQVINVLKLFI